MLRRQLLNRARRLAGATEAAALVDTIVIDRGTERIWSGPARSIFTGKTEIAQGQIGGVTMWQFAEMHLPNGAPRLLRGDRFSIRASPEPALVDRYGLVAFVEPITSLSGFQRITVRMSGQLDLSNPL